MASTRDREYSSQVGSRPKRWIMADNVTLSSKDAYAAMFAFLDCVYERTKSDDVGVLLGGMSLLPDGGTADPAAWADWEDAVRKVQRGEVRIDLLLR